MIRVLLLVTILLIVLFEAQQAFYVSRKEIEISLEAATTEKIIASEVASVAYIIDGDTIELADGRRVRYIGIDAPETAHDGKAAECYGNEAKQENSKRVNKKKVRLEKDVSETDSYGRLLRYVFVDDVFINKHLVTDGFARAWNVPPDERYKSEMFTVEQKAKAENIGLWNACQ